MLGWAWQGFHPFADDRAHLLGGLHPRLDEFRREPWEHPHEVGGHEDLSIAIRTRADANGRNPHGGSDFFGNRRGDEFEDDGESAGLFERAGVVEKVSAAGFIAAFDSIAAFCEDALGKHAKVAEKGNAGCGDGLYLAEDGAAAFGFDGLS